jgi:hypothetical protein
LWEREREINYGRERNLRHNLNPIENRGRERKIIIIFFKKKKTTDWANPNGLY